MSEHDEDIKIVIKKWMIRAIVTVTLTIITSAGTVINFYYSTTASIEKSGREIQDLKKNISELNDHLTRHEVMINNKVSAEVMKDFDERMEREMRDIKDLLNILIEKR